MVPQQTSIVRLTGEPGAVLLREIMGRTRIIEWLVERLDDPREGDRVICPLADLLRTSLLLLGQGWRDQDGADALRYDAGLRLGASGSRGTTPLSAETHLALFRGYANLWLLGHLMAVNLIARRSLDSQIKCNT